MKKINYLLSLFAALLFLPRMAHAKIYTLTKLLNGVEWNENLSDQYEITKLLAADSREHGPFLKRVVVSATGAGTIFLNLDGAASNQGCGFQIEWPCTMIPFMRNTEIGKGFQKANVIAFPADGQAVYVKYIEVITSDSP